MSAMEVCVVSSHTIKVPHNKQFEPTSEINLTPWDLELLLLEYSQKGILLPKPTPQQEATLLSKSGSTSLINHLKESLEQTLHFFPPLVGHLETTLANGGGASCFTVDCHDSNVSAGALFIHAKMQQDTNLTVADIIGSTYVPEVVHSFFPLTGVRNHEGTSRPLLAVQVTELVDGLFIGCSINHLVVDGTSFWHFFSSWAEISRGKIPNCGPLSKAPLLNRDLITLDLTGSSSIKIGDESLILNKNMANPMRLLKDRVFHFSRESVAKLKARANQEMVDGKGKISSLQAIIAHIWLSIIRCRISMNTDIQETTFEIPMGARQRLNPPLPEEYFGNAVFPGIVTLEGRKMLENGMGWTALQINKMVASFNGHDQVKELYMSWVKKPNFLKFDGLPRNHFILINSPRFDVYGNDFGWGKPVAVRSGRANSFDGRITISSGAERGSVDVEACLCPETLCAMVEDAEFMEFVDSSLDVAY